MSCEGLYGVFYEFYGCQRGGVKCKDWLDTLLTSWVGRRVIGAADCYLGMGSPQFKYTERMREVLERIVQRVATLNPATPFCCDQ